MCRLLTEEEHVAEMQDGIQALAEHAEKFRNSVDKWHEDIELLNNDVPDDTLPNDCGERLEALLGRVLIMRRRLDELVNHAESVFLAA